MQNNIFSAHSPAQFLIVLDEVGSTNDYLKSKTANFKPLAEWTAIMARNQTTGRGQRENKWYSEPNVNITFSFLLYPNYIKPQEHFFLNILVSLSIIQWLSSLNIQAKIKWPNDIMIGDKKIAGILIENSLSSLEIKKSIIGIGINVNQRLFNDNISKSASSIYKETDVYIEDLELACKKLVNLLYQNFESFRNKEIEKTQLLKNYNSQLFLRDISSLYSSNNEIFKGILKRVEKDGTLILENEGLECSYQFKEVSFILQ